MDTTSREQYLTAVFATVIMQITNMTMIFLGKVAEPQSGKKTVDLEAAKFFIDQLEMMEAKTKGNLTPDEQSLLKQNLMTVRMTYVEVSNAASSTPAAEPASPPAGPAAAPQPEQPPPTGATAAPDPEDRVKFSKKY